MKITVIDKKPDEENEIIIKCDKLDENIINIISPKFDFSINEQQFMIAG